MQTVQSSVLAESGTGDIESVPSTRNRSKSEATVGKRHIPSASSALIIGSILGLLEAVFLISGARSLLNFMGVDSVSDSILHKQSCSYKSCMWYSRGIVFDFRNLLCLVLHRNIWRWDRSGLPLFFSPWPCKGSSAASRTRKLLYTQAVILNPLPDAKLHDRKFFSNYAVAGDVTNVILDPICIFVFRLGVSGAAIAHVASQ